MRNEVVTELVAVKFVCPGAVRLRFILTPECSLLDPAYFPSSRHSGFKRISAIDHRLHPQASPPASTEYW